VTIAEENSTHREGGGRLPLDGPIGLAWRKLWTALSFLLFGLGAVLFGTVYFPLLWLLVRQRERRERLARRSISALFGLFIRFMGLFVLSWESTGLPPHRGQRGLVVIANHPTLIDAVFLMWLLPGADCVVKASHWRNPLLMFAVRAAGYLPNDDDEFLLTEGTRRVQAGGCLLLFPQGTRTRPGEEPVFRRGAAVIAARSGAPLLPVRIRCAPPALRKGEPWLAAPARRGHFTIRALPAIEPGQSCGDAPGERAGTRQLTAELSVLLLEEVE
jgi:1-acyl-sn-glycerol-3-phosphate acyltransferase